MSIETKSKINELLNQILSNDDSLVYEALGKLDKVSNLFDHISESKLLTSLQGIPRKWGTNDVIVKLATSLLKKLVSNNSSLNHTHCAPSKNNGPRLSQRGSLESQDFRRSFTQSEKNHVSRNTYSGSLLSELKHNFKSDNLCKDVSLLETLHDSSEDNKPKSHSSNAMQSEMRKVKRSIMQSEKNHVCRDTYCGSLLSEQKHNVKTDQLYNVNLLETLHDSSVDNRSKSHSSNAASKRSPTHSIADFQQLYDDPTSSKQKSVPNPAKKEVPDFNKKCVYKTVFSELPHNVSKYTPQNEKISYNLKSDVTNETRKHCVGKRKDELSCWPDNTTEVNGILDEIHSKHSYKFSSTQKMNGHNYLNNNQLRSSESSHFHSKKHSREPECSERTSYYKRKTSQHADSNNYKSYRTNKPDFKSADKYDLHNNSPTKKNSFHPLSSQKQNISNVRSPCRPDFPQPNQEDDSNKESFLSDENKHLMIDTAENCGDTSLDNNSKITSPYSVQLKEGMFRTVKIGPEQEVLRVREIKHFGSGGLEDGAFSWGWSIEKRGSSSLSKEKVPSTVPKDVNRCKRKIDYEKSNAVNIPKKHHPTRDPQKCKQRDSISVKGQDIKSNIKEHLTVSREDKDLKSSLSINGDHECNQKDLNNSNDDKVFKKSLFNNQDHKSKQKEQSKVSSEDKGFKKSFPLKKMPSSPVTQKKTPKEMAASDGNKPIPKVECDQTCSKVIDDTTMNFMSSKRDRRSIYSGRKVAHEIPPLKLLCTEYLKKNILSIRISKSIPYEKLQPILEQCNPSTLHKLEEQNKHLSKYTDKLWEKFCKVRFRDELNAEKDLWKNIYMKAQMKRDEKLKTLAASISNGKTKASAERQAQWMGVDSQDPEKRRKKTRDETPPKIEINGKGSTSSFGYKSHESESPTSPKVNQKSQKNLKSTKKIAPLMSKTKKMLNLVNRRR